jgi:hypothetical protein
MKNITEYLNESLEVGFKYRGEVTKMSVKEYLSVLTDRKLKPGVGTRKLEGVFSTMGFKFSTLKSVTDNTGDTMVFASGFIGGGLSKFVARFKDGSVTEVMFNKGHLMEMTNMTKEGNEDTRYPSVGQVNDGADWRDKIVEILCRKIEDLCEATDYIIL